MIFRKVRNGEFSSELGMQQLYDTVIEINLAECGVKGAGTFFEAQVGLFI